MARVLITGGAGFIGSHYVRHALTAHADWQVTVLDKLTYAGNPANLEDLKGHPRYRFVRGDIASRKDVDDAMEGGVDLLFNFAAETHVDRSIGDAEGFIRILGLPSRSRAYLTDKQKHLTAKFAEDSQSSQRKPVVVQSEVTR